MNNLHPLFNQILRPIMPKDANPTFDRESEKDQEYTDKAEKIYEGFMRNISLGDVRDCLEKMMDDEKVLVNLLQSYFTKNPQVMFNNFDKSMKDMLWELAVSETEKNDS